MKKLSNAIIAHLSNFIRSVLSALGVNEVMFLLGFGAFYRGVSVVYSVEVALLVCGAILIVVSVLGVIFKTRGSKA